MTELPNTKTYTVLPSLEYLDYGQYFHATAKRIIQSRAYSGCVSLTYTEGDTRFSPACIVMAAPDNYIMQHLADLIDAEIRIVPYTFALKLPLALLQAASQKEKGACPTMFQRLTSGRDHRLWPDDYEDGKVVVLFHRFSHRGMLADVVGERCILFDYKEAEAMPSRWKQPLRPAAEVSGTNDVVVYLANWRS